MKRTQWQGARQVNRRTIRRRGSVLVETAAAVLFLLIPLMLGIIQFGLFYNASNVLSQISREGGRYIAVNWKATGGDAAAIAYMKQVGQEGNVTIKTSDVTISPAPASRVQYGKLVVKVTYDMGPSLPAGGKTLFPFIFGNSRVVSRTYTVMAQ